MAFQFLNCPKLQKKNNKKLPVNIYIVRNYKNEVLYAQSDLVEHGGLGKEKSALT
jgi:ribosomal protein S30